MTRSPLTILYLAGLALAGACFSPGADDGDTDGVAQTDTAGEEEPSSMPPAETVAGATDGGDGDTSQGEPESTTSTSGDPAVGDCGGQTCDAEQSCIDDECVPDRDGDLIPDEVDCDPQDATVVASAQRECSSECAPGLEVCTDGVWGECSAPTDCDCDPGDEQTPPQQRELPCGSCGTVQQVCSPQGVWADAGGCEAQGACSPDAIETGTECGMCGASRRTCLATCEWGEWGCESEGTCSAGAMEFDDQSCGACGESQTRTRTCSAACEWGDWDEWSTCVSEGACIPNEVESEEQSCGDCGVSRRRRTCAADGCSWGEWSEWGSCGGEGVCTEGEFDTQTQSCGSCDGERTRSRICTSSCSWGDWSPWSNCEQCQDPTRPSCNANKGVCECTDNSCEAGATCRQTDPSSATGDYCCSGFCAIVVGCIDNDACAPGYYCCGYNGELFSGQCTLDGQTC